VHIVEEHPLFRPLLDHARVWRTDDGIVPNDGWAVVFADGRIFVHPTRRQTPAEWAYVVASSLLHLGFGHFSNDRPYGDVPWNAACSASVARFLRDLKFGKAPFNERGSQLVAELPLRDERRWFAWFEQEGVSEAFVDISIAGPTSTSLRPIAPGRAEIDWPRLLADGVRESARLAVEVASGVRPELSGRRSARSRVELAREWIMSCYPLLGGLASHFSLIEDADICRRLDIGIAAVSETLEEIYVNPAAALSDSEIIFVYAHELLHVGLRHGDRCEGRNAYLWNVACDFVINQWLLEMRVGTPPDRGLLLDDELAGLSAEEIYDRMTGDMRTYRKLATLAGRAAGDILDDRTIGRRRDGFTGLEEFYRSALARGYDLHREQDRGYLPAGLVEEIRSLAQPPIDWDVALAQWFDERFPPLEKHRTFARLSRRQSSTPEIPRPRWSSVELERRTFGIVLDTSGSMDRELLGKALGAVASYAAARDVTAVRLVFCDARAYDEGYVPVEDIATRVRIKGRGGTVLQPGIDTLERARDFPANGPILMITDGYCDTFATRRDHAILMPAGARLPFTPRAPIFRVR